MEENLISLYPVNATKLEQDCQLGYDVGIRIDTDVISTVEFTISHGHEGGTLLHHSPSEQ